MPVLPVETEPATNAGGKSGKAAVLHQGHAQLQRGVPVHRTFGQPALQADKSGKGPPLQAQRETPVFQQTGIGRLAVPQP